MEDFSGTLAYNIAHLKRPRVRRNTDGGSIIPPYIVVTDNIGEALCITVTMYRYSVGNLLGERDNTD